MNQPRPIRAGLLATQGIRGGANREVLDAIKRTGDIFFAVADRDWVLDGATVHISMVGFDGGEETPKVLNGNIVPTIHSNLTSATDVTRAIILNSNKPIHVEGVKKGADFELDASTAMTMLMSPNVNGLPNSDVIRRYSNGTDLVDSREESWIIYFRPDTTLDQAALFQEPFERIVKTVKPKYETLRKRWWVHERPRPELTKKLTVIDRYICVVKHSKHMIFSWMDSAKLASNAIETFVVETDYFFGVLHSSAHEKWARSTGTQLREVESGFRYTPTTCFETFPFPTPTDAQRESIAAAAKELDQLRNAWLNTPEWTRTETLEFPGSVEGPWKRYVTNTNLVGIGTVKYPRLVPKDAASAALLKNRTLTKLYNERPTWLANAHKKLDEAVFAAYGWPSSLTDDELLAKLLELNLARAAKE